jgi:hypothetical protein
MATLNERIQALDTLVVKFSADRTSLNSSVSDVKAAQALQKEVKELNAAVRALLLTPETAKDAADVAAYAYRIRGATDMMLYQVECIINPVDFGFGPFQGLLTKATQVFSLQAVECTRLALCGELAGFHLVIKKHLGA